MAGAELQQHLVQQPVDLPAAQAADALDDAADPRLPAGIEEAGNDAANIAGEGDRQTPDVSRGRGRLCGLSDLRIVVRLRFQLERFSDCSFERRFIRACSRVPRMGTCAR